MVEKINEWRIKLGIEGISPEAIGLIALGIVAGLVVLVFVIVKYRKHFKGSGYFKDKWQLMQKKLPNRESWREAIIEADDLLGEALKKKGVKGKTIGERLVNAQKHIEDKDAVWYGHKLRKKLDQNPGYKPKKQDVKKALLALRAALRDLGAM
jgi:hypothetical protein